MGNKMKDLASPAAPAMSVSQRLKEEVVSFDQFWMKIQPKLKLQLHMKEIIMVDFQSRGLSMKAEKVGSFEAALKKFGYKF